MKTYKEIEKLPFGELEKISEDRNIAVPSDFRNYVEAAIAGEALRKSGKGRSRTRRILPVLIPAFGTALAAVVLTVALRTPSAPKDTFDDPMLAYAELEKTFSYISEKMNRGTDIALNAAPIINKPNEIIEKINNR